MTIKTWRERCGDGAVSFDRQADAMQAEIDEYKAALATANGECDQWCQTWKMADAERKELKLKLATAIKERKINAENFHVTNQAYCEMDKRRLREVATAKKDERERCAKVCDDLVRSFQSDADTLENAAHAIRNLTDE